MNRRQIIAVVILDLVVLAEVFLAVYLAYQDQENFTLVFVVVFFATMIPTLIAGRFAIRRLGAGRS